MTPCGPSPIRGSINLQTFNLLELLITKIFSRSGTFQHPCTVYMNLVLANLHGVCPAWRVSRTSRSSAPWCPWRTDSYHGKRCGMRWYHSSWCEFLPEASPDHWPPTHCWPNRPPAQIATLTVLFRQYLKFVIILLYSLTPYIHLWLK